MNVRHETKPSLGDIKMPGRSSRLHLGELAIPQSHVGGDVTIEFARNTAARELLLPEDGLVFVDMNDAALVKVPTGKSAQVYTKALAGCTGIAGLAKTKDGSFAGISHYDPMVDRWQREGGASPSEKFMYTFAGQARENASEAIELVVAYDKTHQFNPEYGEKLGAYDNWFFLDQLEAAAQYIGKDVTVTFLPYEGDNHTLAVGIDPIHESGIDFE
jgi:hypothetical protein